MNPNKVPPDIKEEKEKIKAQNEQQEKAKQGDPSNPQIKTFKGGTYKVKKGDSLWKIAQDKYGQGNLWKMIQQTPKNKGKFGKDVTTIQIDDLIFVPALSEKDSKKLINKTAPLHSQGDEQGKKEAVDDNVLKKITLVSSPTGTKNYRSLDEHGDGKFGASRKRKGKKEGTHEGIDVLSKIGSPVYSSIDGVVEKIGVFSQNEKTKATLKYIKIKGTGAYQDIIIRIGYLTPNVNKGQVVTRDQKIGIVDDLEKVYREGMPNHLHFELIYKGSKKDPKEFIE